MFKCFYVQILLLMREVLLIFEDQNIYLSSLILPSSYFDDYSIYKLLVNDLQTSLSNNTLPC